jgi:hypothetical protein
MDTKQYTGKHLQSTWWPVAKQLGLGQYLSEIDPEHHAVT